MMELDRYREATGTAEAARPCVAVFPAALAEAAAGLSASLPSNQSLSVLPRATCAAHTAKASKHPIRIIQVSEK